MIKKMYPLFAVALVLILSSGCAEWWENIQEEETPTAEKMQGVWEVVEAYNEADSSILSKISFPKTAFSLGDLDNVVGACGPMWTYIVYGGNTYASVASKIDQFFDYTELNFSSGDYWVADGVVDRFAMEVRLQGLPGQDAFQTLLEYLGVSNQWLTTIVYHKFINIKVEFDSSDDDIMYWEFDNQTYAEYNMKDDTGHYVLWGGVPVENFSKCRFVLQKSVDDLADLITAASNP